MCFTSPELRHTAARPYTMRSVVGMEFLVECGMVLGYCSAIVFRPFLLRAASPPHEAIFFVCRPPPCFGVAFSCATIDHHSLFGGQFLAAMPCGVLAFTTSLSRPLQRR